MTVKFKLFDMGDGNAIVQELDNDGNMVTEHWGTISEEMAPEQIEVEDAEKNSAIEKADPYGVQGTQDSASGPMMGTMVSTSPGNYKPKVGRKREEDEDEDEDEDEEDEE